MSNKRWDRADRTETTLALGGRALDVLWYLLGISGVSAAMTWLFNQLEPVAAFGPAAVALAGVGAGCVIAFALSALMFGASAAAKGYRHIRPLPVQPQQAQPPAVATATQPQAPAIAAPPDTERRLAALERQLGDTVAFLDHARKVVDENTAAVSKIRPGLDAAIAEGKADAERAASARLDGVRKTWDHAFDQLRKRQDAFEKEVKVALADSARDAKASVDGTIAGFGLVVKGLGERLDGLEGKIDEYAERLGERLRELETLPARVQRLLRLRDAVERMNELRACLEPLADRLILAPREEFPDAAAWSAAYKEWHGRLEGFWRMASQWDPPAYDPLAVSGDDLTGVKGVPDDERFVGYDIQQQYRTLIVAHLRHGTYAGFAMVRIDSAAQDKP